MKKIKKINLLLLSSTLILSACGNKESNNEEKNENKKADFAVKQTKYKKDNTTEVLIDKELKKEDIVRSFKHGDHWHVFTRDGKEHIIYTDPEKLSSGEVLGLVSVVSKDKLSSLNVVSIKKHGDHWHVYTADGKEVLTYEDPSSLYPNIVVGTYTGSHGSHSHGATNSNVASGSVDVVKILRHGDHWHIYTKYGEEFISYTDPSAKYSGVSVGVYVGSHGDSHHTNHNHKDNHNDKEYNYLHLSNNNENNTPNYNVNNLNIITILGKSKVNRNDIVRILRHGDHYHIYDSNGNEGLTYENPQKYYPNAIFGEYEGTHEDHDHENHNHGDNNIVWPEVITKIIDHGDHWHLYRGDEEVAVVHENPKSRYPQAEVIEEDGESNVSVDVSELFNYEDVEEKYIESVIPYLSENLKSMTHFGNLLDARQPVYGSNGVKENIFYWLHGNHYHAITISQIVAKAKLGEFGKNTARDVVAVLKYKILNPSVVLEVKPKVDFEEIKKYLMPHYKLTEKNDVMLIDNNVTIYKNGEAKTINISKFDKKDGKIVVLEDLPTFIEKENSNKSDSSNLEREREENISLIDRLTSPVGGSSSTTETSNEETDEERESKEQENIKKLAKILEINEEDVFDVIYDIININFSLSNLEINVEEKTATVNGKKYEIKMPVEEDEG